VISKGQVVYSKRGRDKGLPFIVINAEEDYVYLADGKQRVLDRLKKKKIKHVQPTNTIIDLSIFIKRGLQDADIRKLLLPFKRR
jgi:ribosomal protein L14E/L6E/L27E